MITPEDKLLILSKFSVSLQTLASVYIDNRHITKDPKEILYIHFSRYVQIGKKKDTTINADLDYEQHTYYKQNIENIIEYIELIIRKHKLHQD